MCRVVLQVPITKNVKKPYEMGTEGVSFFLNHQYYENFKKIYLEGAKINVDIAFRKVYNVNDKKTSYKPYIKAVNHKDL